MTITDDPLAYQSPEPNFSHVLFLHLIDLSTLSQSELFSLSVISNSTLDHQPFCRPSDEDSLTPKDDPSLFNKSADVFKQTFLSLKPDYSSAITTAKGGQTGHRLRFSLQVSPKKPTAFDDDEDELGNKLVVHFLKDCMQEDNPELLEGSDKVPEAGRAEEARLDKISNGTVRKRKGCSDGRPNKVQRVDGLGSLEIVNMNGSVVDLLELKNIGDPYGEELRKRAAGLEKEDDLLGFMSGLDGQWCSRRKKRRIVDASLLSDVLPVGWKIIIALRRRSGQYSPYCRRLISPTGDHLLSCKEASSYLRSCFGLNNAKLMNELCLKSGEDFKKKTVIVQQHSAANSVQLYPGPSHLVSTYCSSSREDGKSAPEVDNSPDVQTSRKLQIGSTVGKGVILRDGKYECQFCHKLFLEKKRYSGHVGVHVRNFNRGSKKQPSQSPPACKESPSMEKDHSGSSRIDGVISAANNLFEGITASAPDDMQTDGDPGVEKNTQIGSSFQVETEFTSEEEEGGEKQVQVLRSSILKHKEDAMVANEKIDIDDNGLQGVYCEGSLC